MLQIDSWHLNLQLEALYPDVYKNVHEYGNRYCKGVSENSLENHFSCLKHSSGFDLKTLFFQGIFGIYQGASNHEELHNLMKATLMIRRLKKDVLSELPVKRRQQVVLHFHHIAISCPHFMIPQLLYLEEKFRMT